MAYESEIDFVQHDYHDNDWIGIVTNIDDPTFSGRCQVRVLGLFDGIKPEHLPWAVPINSTVFAGDGAGTLSVPKLGQFIRVQFNNGDMYAPEYTTIQNIDTELINKIKTDYPGTHVLLFDPEEELWIIYQKQLGLQICHKESFIQISPDTLITLQTPNNAALIQMDGDAIGVVATDNVKVSAPYVEVSGETVKVIGSQNTFVGPGPYHFAVLAEPMWALLGTMASALDAKLPATPGVNVGLVEAAKNAATSTNVKISI